MVCPSPTLGSVECMFDGLLPGIADLASLTDAELVDAAGGWARSENAACARKLAVMAEIFARRTGLGRGDRELWWVDPEAAVACELAAVLNVSAGMALHQTHRGVALRDRLPRVAELFEQGVVSDLLVRTIVWRTYLISDDEAMAAVDAALAQRVIRWGALSAAKTEVAIDALVEQHDPGALRRSRESAGSETVQFGSPTDPPGTTTVWARLNAPDAALMEQRVDQMARGVCAADPRSADQRRAPRPDRGGVAHRVRLPVRAGRLPRHTLCRGAGQKRRRLRRRRPEITRRCRPDGHRSVRIDRTARRG